MVPEIVPEIANWLRHQGQESEGLPRSRRRWRHLQRRHGLSGVQVLRVMARAGRRRVLL